MASAFPTTYDVFAALVDNQDNVLETYMNDMRDAVEKIEAKIGIDGSASTTSLDWKFVEFFKGGRTVWIYANTSPTGWTIQAPADVVLAIKGGSYGTTGGLTTGDTWAIDDLSVESTHTHSSGVTSTGIGAHMQDHSSGRNAIHFNHTHCYTVGAGTTHTHVGSTAYRFDACVGILVAKDT